MAATPASSASAPEAAATANQNTDNINKVSPKTTTKAVQMTVTKSTSTAITKNRSFDAFKVFQDPENITGIKGLVTMQPLNKGKEAGWFIENDALDLCKWTASEDDFDPDSVIFNFTHKFGMGKNRNEKTGVLITKPRLQIVLKSQLLVEEKGNMNRILGTYNDLADLYQADKEKEYTQRQYTTRVKYLCFVLKADNTPAHANPIVFTTRGLVSVDLDKKYKQFMDLMQRTISVAFGEDHQLLRGNKFPAICVFNAELGFEEAGLSDSEIVAVRSFVAPDYSSVEAAQESLMALTVPDHLWSETWRLQSSPSFQGYIMAHSQADADKLGGRYGVAPGVTLLPEGAGRKQLPGRDQYGADESL